MPIEFEIPMVPVILGEEEEWIDVTDELNRNKMLFLCDELDEEFLHDIMLLMLFLGEDETQSLYLFINSARVDVINGMALDNIIQVIRSPVMTICLGIAASITSYILAGGAYKKRVALPHARIMINNLYAELQKYEDEDEDENEDEDEDEDEYEYEDKKRRREDVDIIYDEVVELLTLRESLAKGFSKRTGKPLWIISQDMEREIFMSATEAQAYGIVDRVGI